MGFGRRLGFLVGRLVVVVCSGITSNGVSEETSMDQQKKTQLMLIDSFVIIIVHHLHYLLVAHREYTYSLSMDIRAIHD